MSIRNNVIANYASQAFISILAVVMLPIHLRLIGAEGYGLIGFFAILQIWFGVLDVGLSATMGREAARFNGAATDGRRLRELLRAMEWLFLSLAMLGALVIVISSSYLANHWLRGENLSNYDISRTIQVMAAIVALRWLGGLYRGIINGFERQVWLGVYSVFFSALRFVGVVPVMVYFGASVSTFFSFQLAVAVIELFVLVLKSYSLLPVLERTLWLKVSVKPLVSLLRFSLSISFIGVVWVLVTQIDKLLLSKLLTLPEYGLFVMAATAASGVMLFSNPISSAVQPRLAKLHAERKEAELVSLYRRSTQMISVMVFPAAMILAVFSERVLWVWTGDMEISEPIAVVFSLYVLGNAVLAVAAFPYYLQFAKGEMRLHLYGSAIFLVFLVPGIVFATRAYGMTGAGAAWLAVNVSYLMIWVPVVHRRHAPGIHGQWLLRDIFVPAFVSATVALSLHFLLPYFQDRVAALFAILSCGLVTLALTALSARYVRAAAFRTVDGLRRRAINSIASR